MWVGGGRQGDLGVVGRQQAVPERVQERDTTLHSSCAPCKCSAASHGAAQRAWLGAHGCAHGGNVCQATQDLLLGLHLCVCVGGGGGNGWAGERGGYCVCVGGERGAEGAVGHREHRSSAGGGDGLPPNLHPLPTITHAPRAAAWCAQPAPGSGAGWQPPARPPCPVDGRVGGGRVGVGERVRVAGGWVGWTCERAHPATRPPTPAPPTCTALRSSPSCVCAPASRARSRSSAAAAASSLSSASPCWRSRRTYLSACRVHMRVRGGWVGGCGGACHGGREGLLLPPATVRAPAWPRCPAPLPAASAARRAPGPASQPPAPQRQQWQHG